jgi:predicted AAA+ superfamily ATPase
VKRDIENDLIHWKSQANHLPLLLRGARQVGKSYLVEKFGQAHFENILTINFELQPELIHCFTTLDPQEILASLKILTKQPIEPGRTLLFLDEIQDCPNAIRALRYFKEKLPELHVIGAGSLLEFTINQEDFRMPVGRVQSLYLKPLSFKEYLTASGYQDLRSFLENSTLQTNINSAIHQKLLKLIREYMILGGMPAVLQEFFSSQDWQQCQNIQSLLLNTYRNDFGKYASRIEIKYLQRLFEKVPGLIAQHFKYNKVDPDMRSREIKQALYLLQLAGLVYPVYATAASGLPLASVINEKKFKVLFLDVGLIMRSNQLDATMLMREDLILLNRGVLAEQFVGQELLAYSNYFEEGNLYFWSREQKSSTAEVDFVTHAHTQIIPIEVKAGSTGRLKSIQIFMEEKQVPLGIHISLQPLGLHKNILSLPLYMIGELQRLVMQEFLRV